MSSIIGSDVRRVERDEMRLFLEPDALGYPIHPDSFD